MHKQMRCVSTKGELAGIVLGPVVVAYGVALLVLVPVVLAPPVFLVLAAEYIERGSEWPEG